MSKIPTLIFSTSEGAKLKTARDLLIFKIPILGISMTALFY